MFKKIFSGFFLSILSVVLIFALFISIVLNVVLLGTVAISGGGSEGQDSGKYFSEKNIDGNNKESKVLIVSIAGMIADNGPANYVVTSNYIDKIFKQASTDKSIKGIILKVNSPGGTITATDKMYNIIMKYKEKTKIPVVVYFDEIAASGGYYIAMAGDKIISHATTITGSIGVIMSFYQAKELLENKLGIESVVIKSGPHKDIGSSSRTITDKEREILQGVLDEMYESFLDKVRSGRPELKMMSDEELRKIADGRIYTGKQALHHKLIDSIGYFDAAQDAVCELANLDRENTSFVEYQNKNNMLFDLLNSKSNVESTLHSMIESKFTAKFYYLWRP